MNELFPYQELGAQWLAGKQRAYLADEMRLGKSAQAIRACDLVRARFVRVVCPAVARINWAREFEKFGQMRRSIVPILTRGELPLAQRADVTIFSYEMAGDLFPFEGGVLIVDEAHYLKSIDADRSKAVLGNDGLVHRADRSWFMSGTPAPNNPAEMWPVLYVNGVTALTYDEFVRRYCKGYRTPYGFKVTAGKNLDELRALMDPFLLRRLKKDVRPEMPRIMYSDVTVEPAPVDFEIHFFSQWQVGLTRLHGILAAEGELFQRTWLERREFAALEAVMGQTATYRRYVGLQKIAPVVELVKHDLTADPKKKMVLFAWHRDVIEGLRAGLAEFGAVVVWGGTAVGEKQKRIDAFNTKPNCRVFVGNLIAAGTAIPLTGASDGLIVEPSWVPGENAQAAMRMDGPMQTDQITVRFVSIAGSVDEDIQRANAQKARMLTTLFD